MTVNLEQALSLSDPAGFKATDQHPAAATPDTHPRNVIVTIGQTSERRPTVAPNFYEGDQRGVLKTRERVVFKDKISRTEWKQASTTDKAKTRLAINELCQLMGVESIRDLPKLLQEPETHAERSAETFMRLGKMWGIEGREEEIKGRIEGFGILANQTRDMVEAQLPRSKAELSMSNKVRATNDPFRLGLIMIDDRYDQRTRFEAKQKLILIKLAGAIDQRERETKNGQRFAEYNDFLEENVWSRDMRIGQADQAFLLSTHDPETLACTKVTVLTPEQTQKVLLESNQALTPLLRRRFEFNGKKIPVYTALREKDPVKKILKLLRKGKENPAVAVDDELGLMGIFDNPGGARLFTKHLGKSAGRAGSMLIFEEPQDSLNGGKHTPGSPGSSPDIQLYKFHARWNGLRTENLLYTNRTYLDHRLKDGDSHDEFELKRLFDSGVINLLYPPDIYKYESQEMRDAAIAQVRRKIRAEHFPNL